MKQLRLPLTLIVSPFILFCMVLATMQLIYVTIRPPAVFDFVDASSSPLVKFAHDINSILFMVLVFIPWIGAVFILAGIVLLITRLISRRKNAKN